MNRLAKKIDTIMKKGSKALVTFVTAGDHGLETTAEIVLALEEAGADIIELGVPFSDPMADGPTIQLSSERALAVGTTIEGILGTVATIRTRSQVPIVLMGYLNPVHAYGYEKFCHDAVAAGVDGVLLVDMPPEESGEFLAHARTTGLDAIFLLTPTSNEARIKAVNRLGRGFVYYVTVTGVTGARQEISGSLADELAVVKGRVRMPLMAGFGISTPEQAAMVATMADGVVVGSAIVKLFEQYSGEHLKSELKRFVGDIKRAVSHA